MEELSEYQESRKEAKAKEDAEIQALREKRVNMKYQYVNNYQTSITPNCSGNRRPQTNRAFYTLYE